MYVRTLDGQSSQLVVEDVLDPQTSRSSYRPQDSECQLLQIQIYMERSNFEKADNYKAVESDRSWLILEKFQIRYMQLVSSESFYEIYRNTWRRRRRPSLLCRRKCTYTVTWLKSGRKLYLYYSTVTRWLTLGSHLSMSITNV